MYDEPNISDGECHPKLQTILRNVHIDTITPRIHPRLSTQYRNCYMFFHWPRWFWKYSYKNSVIKNSNQESLSNIHIYRHIHGDDLFSERAIMHSPSHTSLTHLNSVEEIMEAVVESFGVVLLYSPNRLSPNRLLALTNGAKRKGTKRNETTRSDTTRHDAKGNGTKRHETARNEMKWNET